MIEAREDWPSWLDVSRETFDRLLAFKALVLKWNPAVNLISRASVAQIWERHILDSAQIAFLADPPVAHWVDLGSGGGFPAIVVAIIAGERFPDCRFSLVESDARKAAFLSQAILALGLPARVLVSRIEATPPLGANILTARALAPLDTLLAQAQQHLRPDGAAFFPKGASYADEVAAARRRWRFDLAVHISRTDSNAAILKVSGIAPL